MKPALRFQIVLFSLVRIVFNTMHRMVYPYLGVFSRGLGVELPELSRAFALRSAAGGLSPLLVFYIDRRGRRNGMLFGLALIIFGAGVLVVWQTLPGFALALVLSTVGYHVFVPVMQAYLGDEIPYRQRGVALAITELGWSLSFILGVPLMGLMISNFGWTSPYPLLALLSLAGLLALRRLLPREEDSPDQLARGVAHSLRVVFSAPAAIAGLVVSMMMTAANEMVNLVFGLWMDTAFGLKIAALGGVAVGIGLAELGGEVLVGGLADRLGKHRAVALGLVGNILAAFGLLLLGGRQLGAVVVLFVFYLTFEFTIVSSLPMMTEVLPAGRASLMAVNIAAIALGRALAAPMGAWLYTLAPRGMPTITPNALAAAVFNLMALAALGLLLRWWHPDEGR